MTVVDVVAELDLRDGLAARIRDAERHADYAAEQGDKNGFQ